MHQHITVQHPTLPRVANRNKGIIWLALHRQQAGMRDDLAIGIHTGDSRLAAPET